jgi:toxin secretion/phage lysis holin
MANSLKMLLAAILAAVGAYMQQLAGSLLVLLAVMVLDYISGISAAWVNHQLSSRIGLIGIVKKVSYLLIVFVGMALDYLIFLLGQKFGVQINDSYFVGLLVIIWLIINECISILENADEMGLPVPGFVKKLLARLKQHTDAVAGETEKE